MQIKKIKHYSVEEVNKKFTRKERVKIAKLIWS